MNLYSCSVIPFNLNHRTFRFEMILTTADVMSNLDGFKQNHDFLFIQE